MHLITGYGNANHVTSANDGVRNAQYFGNGRYVFGYGEQLAIQVMSNTKVRIKDGYGIIDGRIFEIPRNTFEDLTIDSGATGYKRIDVVGVRYEKNASTGIETASLFVKKGTAVASNPTAPTLSDNSILNGASTAEMALYNINIDGATITSTTRMCKILSDGAYALIEQLNEAIKPCIVAKKKGYVTQGTVSQGSISYRTLYDVKKGDSFLVNVVDSSGNYVRAGAMGDFPFVRMYGTYDFSATPVILSDTSAESRNDLWAVNVVFNKDYSTATISGEFLVCQVKGGLSCI